MHDQIPIAFFEVTVAGMIRNTYDKKVQKTFLRSKKAQGSVGIGTLKAKDMTKMQMSRI